MRWLAVLLIYTYSAAAVADERVGSLVRRLADACVGGVIVGGKMTTVVDAGRTATGVCSCAAEIAVVTGLKSETPDTLVRMQAFQDHLTLCLKAGR